MYATDFEYDGHSLSDYNCMICSFDSANGAITASVGSTITFNKVSHNYGKFFSLAGTQYDECLTSSFDICKDPELDDTKIFTDDEFRDLMRWLNRSDGFHQFRIYPAESDVDTCYYNASFNIEKITVSDRIVGMRLTMNTDKPYGYGVEQVKIVTVESSQTSKEYKVDYFSDEIGDAYPTLKITCRASGNLKIENLSNGSKMIIQNCKNGEIISINKDTLLVTTSDSRNIWDDFNYEFFKLSNTLNNQTNKITISLPCTVEMRYTPIIKNCP